MDKCKGCNMNFNNQCDIYQMDTDDAIMCCDYTDDFQMYPNDEEEE